MSVHHEPVDILVDVLDALQCVVALLTYRRQLFAHIFSRFGLAGWWYKWLFAAAYEQGHKEHGNHGYEPIERAETHTPLHTT